VLPLSSDGVDIHHIVPQADGGSDDIDNAAPLCQNCHDILGGNPEKQKEIRQMRDWWYEVCDEKYERGPQEKTLEGINETVAELKKGQDALVPNLISYMREMLQGAGKTMSPSSAASLGSAMVAASTVGLAYLGLDPLRVSPAALVGFQGTGVCKGCNRVFNTQIYTLVDGYCPDCSITRPHA
jgi:uncharacterized coiled-coil protein SlyX